jgi:Holliday junction resolvase RusA-like endonuclease
MIVVEGELYSSKNSKQIFRNKEGRSFIAKSYVAIKDAKTLSYKLLEVKDAFLSELSGKNQPYRISFKIFRKTHRRFDYINIIQNLCDCMVKAGLLEDDNADVVIPEFEPYEVDKDNPRVEIRIK